MSPFNLSTIKAFAFDPSNLAYWIVAFRLHMRTDSRRILNANRLEVSFDSQSLGFFAHVTHPTTHATLHISQKLIISAYLSDSHIHPS